MAGWILAALGAIGGFYSIITIQNDMHPQNMWDGVYSYKAPLTSHETTMIALAVVSVVALLIGIGIIIVKNRRS